MKKVKRVIHLSSDEWEGCPHCQEWSSKDKDLGEVINHYLGHGYELLHVGQETTRDMDGNPWQKTVAVMGIEK